MKSFTDLFIKRPVLGIVVNLVILIAGLQAVRTVSVRQYPRSDIAVVKGIKRSSELLEELESDFGSTLGIPNRVGAVVPRPQSGADSERVREHITERMPVNDREAEVLLHRFPIDDLIGVVMLEIQRVARLGATILDLGDVGEEFSHRGRLAQSAILTIGSEPMR